MAIKVYKSNRAARKNASIVDRRHLHRGRPHRPLTKSGRRISGRGSAGRITVRHRGGGAKRLRRVVDFGQDKLGVKAKVETVEYDPNRSAFIALLVYYDGERRYVLAWDGAQVDDVVVADNKAPERPGNRMQLQNITPGASVYNVEIRPGRGGSMFRAAGASAAVMDIKGKYAMLKLPSGEVRMVPRESFASYGSVSNPDHRLVRIGSAGRRRRMGFRPSVRGKAMNAVDHPHGGGEGGNPIGLKAPKTKWGKPALGVRTRKKGKYSNSLIVSRRFKKRRG